MRYWLDELFRRRACNAVEFHDLSGGCACDAKRFSFGSKLGNQTHRLGTRCIYTAAGQEEIANKRVAEVAL